MTEPKPPQWPLIAGGVLAVIGVTAYFQNSGKEEGRGETAIAELSRRMDEGFVQIRRDIERVDQNSANRRSEIREEVNSLHQQQEREIQEVKELVRSR